MDCPSEKDLVAYASQQGADDHLEKSSDDDCHSHCNMAANLDTDPSGKWDTNAIELHLRHCDDCQDAVSWLQFHHVKSCDSEDEIASSDERRKNSAPNSAEPSTPASRHSDDSELRLSSIRFDLGCLTPSSSPESLGRLGEYEILELIGQGGMGVVFRALDLRLERQVAIKVLPYNLADSEMARRRFRREARAAAAVSHSNVISIYAVEQCQDVDMIVMEYVTGKTLRRLIRERGQMEPMEIVPLAIQIASGLAAAHQQGVIHRDVKPSNIMLQGNLERVKITDFGLARITIENSELTQSDCAVGTPAYMSPEQLRGQEITPSTDLFGLGCVMYAMATGRSPFEGANPLEVTFKVTHVDPPEPHELNEAIPRFLSTIIMRLLEKEPAQRFQSAEDLLDTLNAVWTEWRQANSAEWQTVAAKIDARVQPFAQGASPGVSESAPSRRPIRLWVLAPISAALLGFAASLPLLFNGDNKSNIAPHTGRGKAAPSSRVLHVDAQGQFKTLQSALDEARPYDRIVLHNTQAAGPIDLGNLQNHEGLEIDFQGASIFAESEYFVIRASNTKNLRLKNLRIHPAVDQHALLIEGKCPGMVVDGLVAEAASASPKAVVALQHGAIGARNSPIRIVRSQIIGQELALAVLGHQAAASHILIEHCHISGKGSLVALEGQLEDVEIRHCLLRDGLRGASFQVAQADALKNIRISNNTFIDIRSWMRFNQSVHDLGELRFARNLILRCDYLEPAFPHPEDRFVANWWWTDDDAFARFQAQDIDPQIDMEPTSDNYLHPLPDSPLLPNGEHDWQIGAYPLPDLLEPKTNPKNWPQAMVTRGEQERM